MTNLQGDIPKNSYVGIGELLRINEIILIRKEKDHLLSNFMAIKDG